ncbi:MAG: HAMP domain-containing sensor histidine kinase [Lachnospiraceae bacterium]
MTIKKKLIISNILMIAIPVVLSMIVGTVALKTRGYRYLDSLEEMYKDENGVYSAQSLIYAYKDELTKREWLEYGDDTVKKDGVTLEKTKKMLKLENELNAMGYNFQIKVGNDILFNSLNKNDKAKIQEILGKSYEEIQSLSLGDGECSIVKSTFHGNQEEYAITAVCLNSSLSSLDSESYVHKYILSFAAFFILFILIVVVATNAILSHWISRMVLKPLNILQNGTKEIREGNLDFEIPYEKNDEFGEVCDDFDEMRKHLKESVDTRLAYEIYRKELIAGISHDLRTPLTSIKGYVEGLQDGIADTLEKRNRYCEAIHIRAADMEALVESLSTFAMLENKEFSFQLEQTDMSAYLEDLIEQYREEAKRKKIHFILQNEAVHTSVKIDVQEMNRVFINFFENSAKYRITTQSTIWIILNNIENNLEIKVKDDGPGVPQKELTHIFVSFYRGDQSRTTPGKGSGLGLSIAKQIIERHHGTIQALNHEGLEMIITLPLYVEEMK